MTHLDYDVVVIGSGAGGGTVAQQLAPLVAAGRRVLVLEQGGRFDAEDFTGDELEMSAALYEEGGGFLTSDGAMTLAFGRAYGGSTVVYTGVSLVAPERVISHWQVPGLAFADVEARSRKYLAEGHAHYLEPSLINENNSLFVEGATRAGFKPEQFPVNVRGCQGAGLCNLGCPNHAKQGTHRVQLPAAEAAGVDVVTRAEVLRIEERAVVVRVATHSAAVKGRPSEWAPGEYRVTARLIVVAGGAVQGTALLLRSGYGRALPRLGEGFTCHPAHILVGEHARPITNDVGHPKHYFVDRGADDGYVLETCMYYPFVTAKNLTGFGEEHNALLRVFPRLQMILVLACDKAIAGNRVAIDRNGKAVVHYRFTPEVIQAFVRATRASARIFFAAGAVRVHAPSADPPLLDRREMDAIDARITERHFQTGRISVSAAHMMGGCGMGRDARDSVTDSEGRVHGLPWLRVADASLFPDSVEVNPYITVMALADRVADGILADAGSLFGATPAHQ